MEINETKFCKHCNCYHPLDHKHWELSRGKFTTCKQKRSHERLKNKEHLNSRQRQNYNKNRQKIRQQKNAYRAANKDTINEQTRDKYKLNPEERDKKTEYYNQNKQHILDKNQQYYVTHKENKKIYSKKWAQFSRNNNHDFKLRESLRSRLGKAIKNNQKAGSAVKDLGCTIPELKQYLESKFQEGMTWDNWGVHGWHIDHIIPLASFDLSDRERFLKACHYTNLQPLWAKDNLSKGDRVNYNSITRSNIPSGTEC